MKIFLAFAVVFSLLITGCNNGGSSGNSQGSGNPPTRNQNITRCEAYELGANCLSDSMKQFGTYINHQNGQGINVRQSEDLMTASSEDGMTTISFENPIDLPDFGDSLYEDLKFIAKKKGKNWFSFATANARDFSSASLYVAYSNVSFGYSFDGKIMSVKCSSGDQYSVDNFASSYNDCKSQTSFPFTNITSFDYLSPNRCGANIGLHAIGTEFWFISIYKPLSRQCN